MNNETKSSKKTTVDVVRGLLEGAVRHSAQLGREDARRSVATDELEHALADVRLAKGLVDGVYAFGFPDYICFKALDHQGNAAVYLAAIGVDELLARGLPLPRSEEFSFELGDGTVPPSEMVEEENESDVADAAEDLLEAWCDRGLDCAQNQRLMRQLIIEAAYFDEVMLSHGRAWRVVHNPEAPEVAS